MKLSPPRTPALIRGALTLLLATGAAFQARAEERILKFADPAGPGKIVIQMGLGDLHVTGAEVKEVTVLSAEDLGGAEEPREDGLRRLDSGDNHSVTTSGNTITIACNAVFGGRHGDAGGENSDMKLTVPKGTYIVVQRSGPGDTRLESLTGDIEIRSLVGDIQLAGLAGGLILESTHGDVSATFAAFPADRPVSISTAHGDVEVRVPESAKAKVRFRTLRGEILTDFPKERLTTKMEQAESVMVESEDVNVNVNVDVDVSAESKRARAEVARAREEARQAERAAKEAAAEARRATAASSSDGRMVPPLPPMPPMPAMPPLAGGKVVSGLLNGGGADLSITSLMGDVVFRKGE